MGSPQRAHQQGLRKSGRFLIENLGAERYVEFRVAATISEIRKKMIKDMQIESAAEVMLMDSALMAYFNSLKLQRMFGDLTVKIERDMFHDKSMSVTWTSGETSEVAEFKVEKMLNRASDKLMALIERTNMTLIRNIKALRDLKMGTLTIHAEQVKLAREQMKQGVNGNRNNGKKRRLNTTVPGNDDGRFVGVSR